MDFGRPTLRVPGTAVDSCRSAGHAPFLTPQATLLVPHRNGGSSFRINDTRVGYGGSPRTKQVFFFSFLTNSTGVWSETGACEAANIGLHADVHKGRPAQKVQWPRLCLTDIDGLGPYSTAPDIRSRCSERLAMTQSIYSGVVGASKGCFGRDKTSVVDGLGRDWGDSEHEQWRGQLFITDETKDLIHRVLKRWTPEALKYFKTNKQTNKHGQMSDLVWSSWADVVKLWVNTFQRGRIQPAWAKTAFPNGKLFTSPERQFQCDRSYNVDYVFIICIVP